MYVTDLQNEFYEFLSGKRIFLMVHYDIDSICACKILQNLFKYKHTVYTLVVVKGIRDVKAAFEENSADCKFFILINCGGTVDLVDVLEPQEDIVFFVLDSHRPTDLCNIYSNGQIRLLWDAEGDLNVPEFHDVFREDSNDEENEQEDDVSDGEKSDESDGNPQAKRRRLTEDAILKRREKRLWEEKRNRLLFEYTQFTYYNKASALLIFKLAWNLNLDNKELLWLAIVALTEQMLLGKVENTLYVLESGTLHSHVNRLQNRSYDEGEKATSLRITFERDLRLVLYQHWTVESSLKYSSYTACKLRLWSLRGDAKLHQLLADMGLPLIQSRQNFRSMDLQLRREFHATLQNLSEKYHLEDVSFATFALQSGYRYKYSAADFVYTLLALLECSSDKMKTAEECFNAALECLGSSKKKELLVQGIERFKGVSVSLFKIVQSALEMKMVVTAGPFVYFVVQDSCADWSVYSQQHMLSLLAHFLQQAYVTVSRNRRAPSLPFIVSARCDLQSDSCIVLGVPPLCENSPKNFFGKAFEQAAERLNIDSTCDYFDTSYFKLLIKDRARFFDALTALLS